MWGRGVPSSGPNPLPSSVAGVLAPARCTPISAGTSNSAWHRQAAGTPRHSEVEGPMGNVGAGCLLQFKNKEGVASKFASKVNVTCIFLIVIYNRKNRHKTKRNNNNKKKKLCEWSLEKLYVTVGRQRECWSVVEERLSLESRLNCRRGFFTGATTLHRVCGCDASRKGEGPARTENSAINTYA